jgi:hypothetical protein
LDFEWWPGALGAGPMGLGDATSSLLGAIIFPNGNFSGKQLSLQRLRKKSWRLQNERCEEEGAISFCVSPNFHIDLQAARDCGDSRAHTKFQCEKFLHLFAVPEYCRLAGIYAA